MLRCCSIVIAAVAVAVAGLLSLVNLDHLDGPVHGRVAWLLHKPNFLVADVPALSGKVAVVIGATHGIGYWTALHLAQKGATVFVGCRNMPACQAIASDINQKATLGGKALAIHIDLASRDTVHAFAWAFRRESKELHMLILNAALTSPVYSTTKEGLEQTLGVNWIGGFYLQHLLQEVLEATGTKEEPARVVVVASNAHVRVTDADLTDADFGLTPTPERRAAYGVSNLFPTYAKSKLLNILHARQLAANMKAVGNNVIALSLMPGFIATNIFAGPVDAAVPELWRPLAKLVAKLAILFAGAMDEESGSITTLYAATSPEAAAMNGAYFVPFGREWSGTSFAQDTALMARAWKVATEAIAAWPQ